MNTTTDIFNNAAEWKPNVTEFVPGRYYPQLRKGAVSLTDESVPWTCPQLALQNAEKLAEALNPA